MSRPHDRDRDGGGEPEDAGGDEGGNGGGGKAGGGSAGNGGSDAAGADGNDGGAGTGSGGSSGGGNGGSGDSGSGGGGSIELPDSPANPWIAFIETDNQGFGQLYFVKADGTGLHGYAGETLFETSPAWSPDGTKLAFTAVHESEGAQLHVLDFDSGDDNILDIDLATMARPRFTPDGDAIVFAGADSSADPSALYLADAVDGGATAITEPEKGDGGHDLAPDGTIYFARKLDNSTYDIFSIGAGDDPSTDPVRVTTGSKIIGSVAVHPNGAFLMYAQDVGVDPAPHTTQLVERDIAAGTERNIGEAGDEDPSYFSGGDALVLNRDSFDEDSEIAVTDGDGVLTMRVTDDTPFDSAPAVSSVESDDVDVTQF